MIRHQPLGDPNATVSFLHNVSDLGIAPGSPVSFQVNLINGPPIISVRTIFRYNQSVLNATPQPKVTHLDYSGSIFGSSPAVLNDCIDGKSDSNPVNGNCDPQDQPGSVDVFIANPGGTLLPGPVNGPVFTISFGVLSKSLSPLHFTSVEILNGTNTVTLTVQSFDGYFSNKQCGTLNNLPFVCLPAIADFTMSPISPIENTDAHFNATASRSPNPGASILGYDWDWGGGTNSRTTTPSPLATQTFTVAGPRIVTLTVTDSFRVTGSKSIHINIRNPIINLAIGVLQTIDNVYQGILPGKVITISATAFNHGTRQENNTLLTITLDTGLILANQTIAKLSPNSESSAITATWNTANYAPRVYRIDAYVHPAVNQTDISKNRFSIYIQLINPLPLILLGLSLLQTAGIGIIVTIGVVFARLIFKKQPEVAVGPGMG